MTTLKVNGHVANETKGTLFFTDGSSVSIDRKEYDVIMVALFKDKKIQVAANTTLIF